MMEEHGYQESVRAISIIDMDNFGSCDEDNNKDDERLVEEQELHHHYNTQPPIILQSDRTNQWLHAQEYEPLIDSKKE